MKRRWIAVFVAASTLSWAEPAIGEEMGPAAYAGLSIGCGGFGGTCIVQNAMLSGELGIRVTRRFRVGGVIAFWERQPTASNGADSSAFQGVAPFSEIYFPFAGVDSFPTSVDLAVRLAIGATRSDAEDQYQPPSGRLGVFAETSGAVHVYFGPLWLGPRIGVVAFAGQHDHFPIAAFVSLGAGLAFGT